MIIHQNYDDIFGPGGPYAWPADLDVAKEFIRAAPGEKSSADCLNDWFFSHMLGFDQEYDGLGFDEEEIDDLVEAKITSTQELFHDAKNWPLPYLVGSAVYYIVSKNTEKIHMIYHVWRDFLWLFLLFDEPLFDMLRGKRWDKIYKNSIREGFKRQLEYEIQGLTNTRLIWSSDKDKPWFTPKTFTPRIYPEDVLRCLDLVGIDRDLAHMAVDQMFKLQSLTPFYDVLINNSSLIAADLVKIRRFRDENELAENCKKSSADLRIHIFNFVYGALLFAGAAIAFTRFRSPRSNCTSIAHIQSQPGPCFAAVRMGRNIGIDYRHSPSESPERYRHSPSPERHPREDVANITASASHKAGPRLFWKKIKEKAGLVRAKILRDEGSSFIFIENNKKRWELSALQNQPSAQTDENQPESQENIPKGRLLLDRLRSSLNRQKSNRISAFQQASGETVQQQEPSKLRRTQTSLISKWVNNRQVFIEESPEIQKLRADLNEDGIEVPDYTRLCLHAERTKTAEGKEVISITSQGTLANRNAQEDILKWVKDYFVVDGQRVVIGGSPGSHENDHVVYSSLSDIFKLRNSSPAHDRGSTVKLPKNIHAIRTHNPVLKELTFDLKTLNEPLPRILEPIYEADKTLWMMDRHANAINKAGLTPEFLVNQYAFAHKLEVGRMIYDLRENKKFDPKQGTAFLVDRLLDASITLSTDNFISFEPTPPVLELKDKSVLSRFTSYQVERAYRCYFKEVRLYNLPQITDHFSEYTKLAHSLELYSQSPEGEAEGCNKFQTDQHRETKMRAIHSFKKALKYGEIPERETKEALNKMLVLATVDKDGNSTEGLLPIGEVKDRIYTIGEGLKINYLYKRRSVYSMTEPKLKDRREYYKECVKNAARKPRNASLVPEQESSYQDSIFLD